MKKLWISFKVLLFFFIFPISSHSIELSEYGLNHNSFSELQELRTIYAYGQDGKAVLIDPEEPESLIKIKEFSLNNNFLSNEADTVYQFCCDSKSSRTFIIIGKINGAEKKFKTLSIKEAFNLDKQIKIKNYLEFEDKKLFSSLFIKNDKYNLFQINSNEQEYQLFYNIPRTFKDTIESFSKDDLNEAETDSELSIVFTPSYTSITHTASRVSVFKVPGMNSAIILDNKNNKIIYTDENLKKIQYHGDYGENVDVQNPSSFLNPTLLNFLPTEFKKLLNKGREINSNYPLNFTLNELIDLISNVETLNADNVSFAKQKESELQSIIQKNQAELKAKEDRIKAEELKASQLEEQKVQEERQKILDKQAEEENQRMLAEYAAADAAEKRQKYMQYGLIILLIGGLIAFIFLTNFLDNLQKFLKQIINKFKKKKAKNYLPDDYGKKKSKQKKLLDIWWADWANGYEKPLSATLIATASYIVGLIVTFKILQITEFEENTTIYLYSIMFILFAIPAFYLYQLWSGIFFYHCPKCKRIHAGEVYSSAHIGSQQRAKTYRVKDRRTIRHGKYQNETTNYTVESDETGIEQIDTYHNKAKCKLCSHKWEYNSSTSTRVA